MLVELAGGGSRRMRLHSAFDHGEIPRTKDNQIRVRRGGAAL